MIKVYASGLSRSRRVLWALEEIGVAYEVVDLPWPPRDDPGFLEINPAGTVPVIEDGDVRLTESLVICEYLGRTYGDGLVMTPDEPDYLSYQQFMHYGEGTLQPPVAWMRRFGGLSPEAATECREAFRVRLDVLEQALADGRAFLAGGRFTVADLSVGFVLKLSSLHKMDRLIPPTTADYAARLQARPAFLRAYKPA